MFYGCLLGTAYLAWSCVCLGYTVKVSVRSCVHLLCCVWKMLCPLTHPPPWILQDLCPLFHTDIWALRGEVWHRYSHLGLTIPKSLILCMLIICRFLYWLQSFTRNFSHEGWVVYLPMGIANLSVEVVLLWFSGILLVGSSLRPMAI